MQKKNKKLIAPIVVAFLLSLYYLGIGILFMCIQGASLITKLLAVVIPSALTITLIFVLIQRIKEIRKGEDDDLRNY